MTIDQNISDLFFNTDVSVAEIMVSDEFQGWDEEKLRDEAQMFLNCLHRLGIAIPTVDELLADFHARV